MGKLFKQKVATKTKVKATIVITLVALLFLYIILDIALNGPITSFLSNREEIINTVNSLGVFAPLIFILIQTLQTIFAPIPGQVTGTVGGYIFGWWGILWTFIGSAIGYIIVLFLARRFGRPLLEKFFKKDALKRFDFLTTSKHASFALFMIFLLPGLPDDMVCYLAGLTSIPLKKLMVLILIGRLPSIVATNYVGAGFSRENLVPVIVASVAMVLVFIIAWIYRERIINYLKSKSEDQKSAKK